MKSRSRLLVLASLTILTLQNALAGSVKVISNSSVTAEEISTDELRNIFLQTHGSLQEHMHVEPVLQKRGLAHEVFLKEVLHQSDDTLQNYYRTLVFTGKGQMPKAFGSDAEVLAYVARTRGAIGYISTTTESEGVKTLVIADAPEGTERKVIARVEPEYPETLLRLHIGGTVRLKVTISPKGGVEKVELLGGNPILAESAMIAVKQWIYTASHSRSTTEVSIPFAPR